MKSRNLFVSGMLVLLLVGQAPANTPTSSSVSVQESGMESILNEVNALLASRAAQYGVKIDMAQAKLFQFGQWPAVMVPLSSFSLTNLGLIGLLEIGGPMEVKGIQLPAGSYRMEVSGDLASRQLLLYLRDEFGNRVVSIPVEVNTDVSQMSSGQVETSGTGGGRNSAAVARVIGPAISMNFNLIRTSPYIRNLRICITFVIPIRSGTLTLRFCL